MAEVRAHRAHRARRGSSFVEVLVAMTLMALVLVGILQMFSVSLIVNKGSAARTQMLFKCQQVVENIRWYYYVTQNIVAIPPATGIPPVLGATPTTYLPYTTGELTALPFWGPTGANVMEVANGPYQISYTIAQDASITTAVVWVITVSAVPTAVAGGAGAPRYFGISTSGSSGKRVDYVAQYVQ